MAESKSAALTGLGEEGINSESHFITRHSTPVRDVTIVPLPAGREHNYLTF